MTLRRTLAACAVASAVIGGMSAAHAATVFSDNFDSYAYADSNGYLNWVPPAKWTVTSGSVDLIGAGTNFDLFGGADGKYVDLDGSTYQPGALTTIQSFGAGTYTLEFLLGGNQRGDGDKTTTITLGDWSSSITLGDNAPMTLESFLVTTNGGQLTFADLAGGNAKIGNELDNVVLSTTAAPEPATWAMLGMGFAALGFVAMRKGRRASLA